MGDTREIRQKRLYSKFHCIWLMHNFLSVFTNQSKFIYVQHQRQYLIFKYKNYLTKYSSASSSQFWKLLYRDSSQIVRSRTEKIKICEIMRIHLLRNNYLQLWLQIEGVISHQFLAVFFYCWGAIRCRWCRLYPTRYLHNIIVRVLC